MEIYTIGFTKKSAEKFFNALRKARIKRLIDVRLNNSSQLAGFTKRDDIEFFLKELCDAEYVHKPMLAPTKEILDGYKKKKISWQDYERRFMALMANRKMQEVIGKDLFEIPTILLCSEPKPDKCHRRLVAEYLREKWGDVKIIHL
ncbi:MAG: DUF488 domain-containing protein [Deltaproteobacteria bacterium]|nr:DUF488 domain-containing protein [Deltaproteobacteria bacterium]MBW1909077.1 DUF488 domain-containing protein [Deltaproteobacteria bacterium]MBW2034514.1 DUF488 domain-containing protein [Deltaproteobacteria bacterium]MBW2114824.1 DUF488 domain-containing protein [Deltaproteobacteria bacterium]MBW2168940.1 DUF488 domain-containing protein [Deltaproteobacteria bacterium]